MGLLDNIKNSVTDASQKVSNAVKNFKVEDITSNLTSMKNIFQKANYGVN